MRENQTQKQKMYSSNSTSNNFITQSPYLTQSQDCNAGTVIPQRQNSSRFSNVRNSSFLTQWPDRVLTLIALSHQTNNPITALIRPTNPHNYHQAVVIFPNGSTSVSILLGPDFPLPFNLKTVENHQPTSSLKNCLQNRNFNFHSLLPAPPPAPIISGDPQPSTVYSKPFPSPSPISTKDDSSPDNYVELPSSPTIKEDSQPPAQQQNLPSSLSKTERDHLFTNRLNSILPPLLHKANQAAKLIQ